MERVSLAELERATKNELFITYYGLDGESHRFATRAGRVFLVPRDELEVRPVAPPTSAGIGLFVKIEGGKLTVPDPQEMAEWVRSRPHVFDELAAPDEPRDASLKPLLVEWHDEGKEPAVLILESDGWEGELDRLDPVLDRWVCEQRPGYEEHETLPEQEQPRLRYDEDESAGDLKTIVIRAWHFRSEWVDSLADYLGKEFPFLWKLKVGWEPMPFRHYDWDDSFVRVPAKQIPMDDGSVVVVEPFEIARYPVSIEQFSQFVAATGYVTSAEKHNAWKNFRHIHRFEGQLPEHYKVLPVQYVSYRDALAYCAWANVRLPTEMEYLAAWLLDGKPHERSRQTFARKNELSRDPLALRMSGINFTSVVEQGRVIYRAGPMILRISMEEHELMGPLFRRSTDPDSYRGEDEISIRVCKPK